MSREEAIEILSEMRSEYNLFGDEEEATRYHVLSWAIKAMNAEPVKHGKWIEEDDAIITGTCSVCGWFAIFAETDVTGMPFCPNCGAKMDGGKDDE